MVEPQTLADPSVVEAIQAAYREADAHQLRVLVTGATGFVGSRLANALAAAGCRVTASGRNPYRARLDARLDFQSSDVRDRERILELCRGQDVVIHAAANSSPWGPLDAMRAVNVEGTRNVLDGCRLADVGRCVHVSSTAVFFEHRDRTNVKDDDPLARRATCTYAQTKIEAEQLAQAAADSLDVFTVRARAVFGPGDNSLLPRLMDAARSSRLRVIGRGDNQVDMTYVDNLVVALALAAVRGERGAVCTVTNDEPIPLWPMLEDLLTQLGVLGDHAATRKLRRVPLFLASLAARVVEMTHRLRNLPGEPSVTRYSVGLLARTQTFDITEARRQLDYQPLIVMQEGLRRTVDAWLAKDETPGKEQVSMKIFSTGRTSAKHKLVEAGGGRGKIPLRATIALIVHPQHGPLLFDTGYAPRFHTAASQWPYKLYGWLTPVETSDDQTAAAWLASEGIPPTALRRIVLSHFHADHISGLLDFPNAEVIAHGDACRTARFRGLSVLRRGVLPDLMPSDLEKRWHPLEMFHDSGWGPWEHTCDLFGDGSIRLIELPGHADGQIGALVQTLDGEVLLAADAAWTVRTLTEPLPLTWVFRAIAVSSKKARQTAAKLFEASSKRPDLVVVTTHCPKLDAIQR